MKIKATVSSIDHDELVSFLCTATYGDTIFDVYVPEECKKLKFGEGYTEDKKIYEEGLANALLNGGMIYVKDNESYDENVDETKIPNHNTRNLVTPFFDAEEKCWVYPLKIEDFYRAFSEIVSNEMTGEYSKGTVEDFHATFDEEADGDFFNAWNVLQYVIFGDIVYG